VSVKQRLSNWSNYSDFSKELKREQNVFWLLLLLAELYLICLEIEEEQPDLPKFPVETFTTLLTYGNRVST
jgi:hypothetical protein